MPIRITSGSPAVGVGQHVGAALDTARGRVARAVEHRELLARQRERRRARPGASIASRQASTVSVASAGPHEAQVRDRAQRRVVLDRLVRRAVLAEADRVVRPDVDRRGSPGAPASRTAGRM